LHTANDEKLLEQNIEEDDEYSIVKKNKRRQELENKMGKKNL
jgi:hypothetical protein